MWRFFPTSSVISSQLVRVAVGPLALGDLAKGAWRHLTPNEVAALGGGGPPRPRRAPEDG